MSKGKKHILLPQHKNMLDQLGEQIKLARKRRRLTMQQVAERSGITRTTYHRIERGDAQVSMGGYFNVLRTFGLQNDFLKLAADDEFGRKLQDLKLLNGKK